MLGLIGPNGAGKTTLLECIAGLLPLDAGRVDTESRRFYMPDGIAPWEAQRVGWVLRFFDALHAAAPGARESLIVELGLMPLLGQRMGELSRGQRKRVLLGLGLLTPHPLLLFDEPFESLDVRQVRETAALLRRHAAAGRGLMLSIHQLADASRVCDRMVLLRSGVVLGIGTLDELRATAGLPDGSLEDVFLALT